MAASMPSVTADFYPRPPGGGRRSTGRCRHRRRSDFYPRPPGGGRHSSALLLRRRRAFLSTPSGWRATTTRTDLPMFLKNFYPRPPGGGRLEQKQRLLAESVISIHALRVEGDICTKPFCWPRWISIHALRVEGDPGRAGDHGREDHFYPRPPGGGRLCYLIGVV